MLHCKYKLKICAMDGKFLRNTEGKTERDRIENEVWVQILLGRVKRETIEKEFGGLAMRKE